MFLKFNYFIVVKIKESSVVAKTLDFFEIYLEKGLQYYVNKNMTLF